MKREKNPAIDAAQFARQVSSIAFYEWGHDEHSADCLVLGRGDRADALAELLMSCCRSVAQSPKHDESYDLIFLLEPTDVQTLCRFAARDALLVDADMSHDRIGCFDAAFPFRQVRVVALCG